MIRIHTTDGNRHDTKDIDWDTAMSTLRDPDAVFDVTVQTNSGGKRGYHGRLGIPVRHVVAIDPAHTR